MDGLISYFQRLTETISFAVKIALDVVLHILDFIVYVPVYVGIAIMVTTSIFIVRFLLFK